MAGNILTKLVNHISALSFVSRLSLLVSGMCVDMRIDQGHGLLTITLKNEHAHTQF